MNSELSNYIKRCINPSFAFSALIKLIYRIFLSLYFRILPNFYYLFLPNDIIHLRRKLLRNKDLKSCKPLEVSLEPWTLTLAACSFNINANADWFKEFSDVENTMSLHRWNWLLRGLTDDNLVLSKNQGLNLMRSWIYNCEQSHMGSRDAYTIGERIVNGSLFLVLTGNSEIPKDISDAFKVMGRQVANNLEFYPSELTGNHAFNNARALLFAGLVAKLPFAVDLAYAISKERLPKLVTPDGFLREGSSHYHFLFTRWVLEMLWLAERNCNEAFVQLLNPYAKLLVQRCWFFLVQNNSDGSWQIPLIGDVSPDCPPGWILGLPWSSLACGVYLIDDLPTPPNERGWSDLFGIKKCSIGTSCSEQTTSFPKSGWFRIYRRPWTVFIRAESSDGSMQASHKHNDLGSFVLFRNGSLLITDSGRLDYTRSPLSLYGNSALGHNSLFLDGLCATSDSTSWLSSNYLAVQAIVEVKLEVEDTVISLKHNGFARFAGNPILHQRLLRLNVNSFRIEDQLDGRGARRLQMRYHFAPGLELHHDPYHGWRVGNSCLKFLTSNALQALVQSGQVNPPFGGLFFPEYGYQRVNHTLDLSGTMVLPVVITNVLIEENK
jgi:hypothetical protein